MSHGVFVLGMHRSGTSAATRLINLLGVPLCDEGDLLPGTDDNPRGYWESGALTAFNDRILGTLECDWSCPPLLEAGWETDSAFAELRAEAATVFREVHPTEEWVWKDPRNCITFPFWASCLESDLVVVLVHRNPLEIAASLGARDDLGSVYSLALWERYLRSCLSAVAGLPTLVTTFAEIVDAPLDWCETVREFLSQAGVTTEAVTPEEALEFVGAELRHARFTEGDVVHDPAVSMPHRELQRALEELRGTHETLAVPELSAETPSTEALLAERRRHYPLERRHRELGEYARKLGEQFVELEQRYVELQRDSKATWEQFLELQRYSEDLGERFLALETYARELQRKTGTR
jgi:hypothetical protein